MNLVLVHGDGTVIKNWDIEDEFGDVSRTFAAKVMAAEVLDEILRAKSNHEPRPEDQGR